MQDLIIKAIAFSILYRIELAESFWFGMSGPASCAFQYPLPDRTC